jgi:hypothetical protein
MTKKKFHGSRKRKAELAQEQLDKGKHQRERESHYDVPRRPFQLSCALLVHGVAGALGVLGVCYDAPRQALSLRRARSLPALSGFSALSALSS